MTMRHRGFTLVELMIAIAVIAILLMLAAPSFVDYMRVQRLKGVNAQLVTDLQYARTEAASRNGDVYIHFKTLADDASMSCYTIYMITNADWELTCDCTQAPGASCADAHTVEIRTVQVPVGTGVRLTLPENQPASFGFIAETGALRVDHRLVAVRLEEVQVFASIDDARSLRTTVGRSGRPTVCSPGGGIKGVASC